MDEQRSPTTEERDRDAIAREHIAGRVAEGASREVIMQELILRGYDPAVVRRMVGEVARKQHTSARTSGLLCLVAGILVAGLAIGVTISSFSTAADQGGTYVICWGAALFGLYLIFRGIRQLVSGRKAK